MNAVPVRFLIFVAMGFAVAGTVFIGAGAAFCSATLHVRRLIGPKPPGAVAVQILAKDNAALKAWWFEPAASNGGCVVVLHGIGDSRASSAGFAPFLLNTGYSVLAPDSRAHGESGGAFVTYGLLERYDVIGWAHWMQKRGCRRLYGLGESLGASILIQATAVEPVFQAVVAECPFADLRKMAEFRAHGFVPLWIARGVVEAGMLYARSFDKLDFEQATPLESMAASSTPILLIHGMDDVRTPPSQSEQLFDRRPAKSVLWLVPHGGHTNASTVAPAEFWKHVLAQFSDHA